MGAYATGTPLVPLGYVAGTLAITGGAPVNLIDLIVAQLDVNCDRGARNVIIQAGGAALFIGTATTLGGALSATNYGRTLATGLIAEYHSNFPGSNSPLGSLQVFMASSGSCHVEVW
jgi:hypothetical protein